MKIKTIIYATLIAISLTATTPLYLEDIKIIGGGLLNSIRLLILSLATIKVL